jgi:hypothetical protein
MTATVVGMSLLRSVTHAVGRNVLVSATLAAALAYGLADGDKESVYRPAVADSAAALVEEHGCWTGAAPAGAVAGHVVVTVDGVTRYAGQRMADRAIEQAVFGIDHGLTVHGFCS